MIRNALATAFTAYFLLLLSPMLDQGAAVAQPGVVQLTAVGLEFEGPDEIPSGWTTIRLVNASAMTHFALVGKYPEGRGVADHQEVVAPIFQAGMDDLNEGQVEAAMEEFGKLPEWFGEIEFVGGPGFLGSGRTAQATVHLEPGTYVVECYVKTDGVFHSYNPAEGEYGMVHEFTVLDEPNGRGAPEADVEVSISSEGGIEFEGNLTPGRHTVEVTFADQVVHEHFLGHDLHLARLSDDSDLQELETWMNWTLPTGLETPAPVDFVGGINEMSAGKTGYFTVFLTPGRYAWVAEVPNAVEKGMLETFTVE